jgi:hypothetical protein
MAERCAEIGRKAAKARWTKLYDRNAKLAEVLPKKTIWNRLRGPELPLRLCDPTPASVR